MATSKKKLILVFVLGFLLGLSMCFALNRCNSGDCGLLPGGIEEYQDKENDTVCTPTCLLLIFIDEEGERVPGVVFTLTNATGDMICSGTSNTMGEYVCSQRLFGCGDQPSYIHIVYSYSGVEGGIYYFERDYVLSPDDACSLDPTFGCCRVLVEVDTG